MVLFFVEYVCWKKRDFKCKIYIERKINCSCMKEMLYKFFDFYRELFKGMMFLLMKYGIFLDGMFVI